MGGGWGGRSSRPKLNMTEPINPPKVGKDPGSRLIEDDTVEEILQAGYWNINHCNMKLTSDQERMLHRNASKTLFWYKSS